MLGQETIMHTCGNSHAFGGSVKKSSTKKCMQFCKCKLMASYAKSECLSMAAFAWSAGNDQFCFRIHLSPNLFVLFLNRLLEKISTVFLDENIRINAPIFKAIKITSFGSSPNWNGSSSLFLSLFFNKTGKCTR